MAKGNSNGTLRIILIVIAILVTLALAGTSAVLNYGDQSHQTEDNSKDIEEMKPGIEKNTTHRLQDEIDTIGVKKDIKRLSTQVGELETAQEAGFREILKRLPE